jgi:hypothetical protein
LLTTEIHVATLPSPEPTPADDEILSPDIVIDVLEELLDVQHKSYILGLKLKLPLSVVEKIHSKHAQPRDQLLHVLREFLCQKNRRPTWRVIVDALKSRVVDAQRLARRVEEAHQMP